MARQRSTSGRRVGSSGRSEVVGAMLRGEPGVEAGAEAEAEAGGVPLTGSHCQGSGGPGNQVDNKDAYLR